MANHRKDSQAEQMYVEYQKGYSLTQIAQMFNVTRQSVYIIFKRRGLELRKKQLLPYLYFNGKKYTLRNTGYYGRTDGERTLMHRDVWESIHGKIPKGYDIHHKDKDKSNNDISNLELLRKDEHARRYSTGNNQFTKKGK